MYILGIDAGATKSHVVLWEANGQAPMTLDSALLDTKHPGINLDVISTTSASERLLAMIDEAALVTEKERGDFLAATNIVLGMAGLDTELDYQNAQRWVAETLPDGSEPNHFKLVPDVELALWAATSDGVGILLIAGTGSNCFGRNQSGQTAKAGGLSHFFSDEGSGFMLGWDALHHVAQMYDGRLVKERLYDELLREYDEPDFPHLKRRIVQSADYKHEVAKAAPAVQRLAQQGEPHALSLIDESVAQLAVMVQTVYRQLNSGSPLPVYLVGGLFRDELYRDKLSRTLDGMGIAPQVKHIEFPVLGTWRLAA